MVMKMETNDVNEKDVVNIILQTGLSRHDIEQLIAEKQKEIQGISKADALFLICKEFAIDLKEMFHRLSM